MPSGSYNECTGISEPIVGIVKSLDKAVDVVVSGRTHHAHNCQIDRRMVTSADKYGRVVTQVDLLLDPKSRDVISASANNTIVRTSNLAKDPQQTELISPYKKLSEPLARRVVGHVGGALSSESNAAGESPIGQVIANAQLAATRNARRALCCLCQRCRAPGDTNGWSDTFMKDLQTGAITSPTTPTCKAAFGHNTDAATLHHITSGYFEGRTDDHL